MLMGFFLIRNNEYAGKKSIAGLQSTVQNERYVSGIFDNEEKNNEQ